MRILGIISFLFLCGCMTSRAPSLPVKVIDSEEVTWIVESVTAKWKTKERQRLKLEHSQVHYSNSIKRLNLEFSSQEILEMGAARNLLVDLVEDFMFAINTNPIISDQLGVAPFTPDRLDIEIRFESFHGMYVDVYYVGCICMNDGMVRYSAFDMDDDIWHSWHSTVEPYTKSREVSILGRAADKAYKEQRKRECGPSYLDEMLIMEPCGNPDRI